LPFLIQPTGWYYKTYAIYTVAESDVGERFWGSIVNRRCGVLGYAVAERNIVLKKADSSTRLLARALLGQEEQI
jgi:hypothetical protein